MKIDLCLKKTILYRTLSISSEFLFALLITGQILQATAIECFCIVAHTVLYYTIERKIK